MQSFRRLTAAAPAIRSLLALPPTISSSRQFVRRLAQSSEQGGSNYTHGTRSSDLPWIIGAVAFTVPATFYLVSGSSKPAHHSPTGHDHGHATEAKDSNTASPTPEEEEDSPPDEAETTKQPDSTDSKNQDTEESSSTGSDQAREVTEETGEEAEVNNKAETSETGVTDVEKVGGTPEGVTEKKTDEHTSGKPPKEDETKDDGNKTGGEGAKKTSSGEGKKPVGQKNAAEKGGKETTLERLNREKPNKKPSDIDYPAAGMKDVTSANMQSGKQEGISNGDTWHAVLHSERGQSISKKAEGAHQTAKLKGTVDPFRPANYDSAKKQ